MWHEMIIVPSHLTGKNLQNSKSFSNTQTDVILLEQKQIVTKIKLKLQLVFWRQKVKIEFEMLNAAFWYIFEQIFDWERLL